MTETSAIAPPTRSDALTEPLLALLDGSRLDDHPGEAIGVATTDEAGWPRGALLSFGELLALDARRMRFVINPHSSTTRNIERDGRIVLTVVQDGAAHRIRLQAKRSGNTELGHNTAMFDADVLSVETHRAPYAELTSGPTYTLTRPDEVMLRWREQIRLLRAGA